MVNVPSATTGVFAQTPGMHLPTATSKGAATLTRKLASAPSSPCGSAREVKPTLTPSGKSSGYGVFSAAPHPSAGFSADRPSRHCVDFGNRAGDYGVVTTVIPPARVRHLANYLFLPIRIHPSPNHHRSLHSISNNPLQLLTTIGIPRTVVRVGEAILTKFLNSIFLCSRVIILKLGSRIVRITLTYAPLNQPNGSKSQLSIAKKMQLAGNSW